MTLNETHRTIDWIDKEIRFKRTGSPIQLAGKLSMSVRMLYFYLDVMKSLGAQITYSKETSSFEYINVGHFVNGHKWVKG